MRRWMSSSVAAAVVLLAIPVLAGARARTKAQLSIVALRPSCRFGFATCNNGRPGACVDDADCDVGILALGSMFKLDGKLRLVVKVKGVADAAGALVTTDGVEGSGDDYVFRLSLQSCPGPCSEVALYLKTEVSRGKGKLVIDLGTTLPPGLEGLAVMIAGSGLYAPPDAAANCPGANTVAAITARLDEAGCESGGMVGAGGVLDEL